MDIDGNFDAETMRALNTPGSELLEYYESLGMKVGVHDPGTDNQHIHVDFRDSYMKHYEHKAARLSKDDIKIKKATEAKKLAKKLAQEQQENLTSQTPTYDPNSSPVVVTPLVPSIPNQPAVTPTTGVNDDGSLNTTTDNGEPLSTFDNDGREIEANVYDANGDIESTIRRDYDANGNVTAEEKFGADGYGVYENTMEYDVRGNLTRFEQLNAEEGSFTAYEVEYDDDNNVIKKTFIDEDGNPIDDVGK